MLGATPTRPPPAAANLTWSTASSPLPLNSTVEPAAASRRSPQRARQLTPDSVGESGVPTPPPPWAEAMPAPAQVVARTVAIAIRVPLWRRLTGALGCIGASLSFSGLRG